MTSPAQKLDLASVPFRSGTRYPARFNQTRGDIPARRWQRVGDEAGLTLFGVNRVTLAPGAASSLRHWHTHEDEFAVVLEGEAVMITDRGETLMRAGDMAGFPKGHADGHVFVNRSAQPAVILAVGSRDADSETHYSDVDLIGHSDRSGKGYTSRAGERYGDTP